MRTRYEPEGRYVYDENEGHYRHRHFVDDRLGRAAHRPRGDERIVAPAVDRRAHIPGALGVGQSLRRIQTQGSLTRLRMQVGLENTRRFPTGERGQHCILFGSKGINSSVQRNALGEPRK